jgi:hypothetical protein
MHGLADQEPADFFSGVAAFSIGVPLRGIQTSILP